MISTQPQSVPYLLHFILILGENHEPSTQNSCGKMNIGNYTYTYGHIMYIMCKYIYVCVYYGVHMYLKVDVHIQTYTRHKYRN